MLIILEFRKTKSKVLTENHNHNASYNHSSLTHNCRLLHWEEEVENYAVRGKYSHQELFSLGCHYGMDRKQTSVILMCHYLFCTCLICFKRITVTI